MMKDYTITWNKFKIMPPEETNVLIWRGLKDSDGGFPLIGRLFRDVFGRPYMCYKIGYTSLDMGYITEEEFRQCLWARIPMPEQAEKKMVKDIQRGHARCVI